jgi:hypothetical protein
VDQAEHIDTLHFSLKALQKFSKCEIIIITDTSRNEIPISHNKVIDIKTPDIYDNHQASIFLKTSIHRYLPIGRTYCYIDTDVVAIDEKVDTIFEHRNDIINFSSDHCKVSQFSPYAVNCGCMEKNAVERKELNELLLKYEGQEEITNPLLLKKRDLLIKKFHSIKVNKLAYLGISLRFLLSPFTFKLDDDTYYNRWKNYWHDKQGRVILYAKPRAGIKLIEKNTKWKWDKNRSRWLSPEGNDIEEIKCNHLVDFILYSLGIKVKNYNWQHWNGGVFLFDDKSHSFLESWHAKTLKIFENPQWKTRDQGTLIATAWEFGLQVLDLLPISYNFLADYNHPSLRYLGDLTFRFEGNSTVFKPISRTYIISGVIKNGKYGEMLRLTSLPKEYSVLKI